MMVPIIYSQIFYYSNIHCRAFLNLSQCGELIYLIMGVWSSYIIIDIFGVQNQLFRGLLIRSLISCSPNIDCQISRQGQTCSGPSVCLRLAQACLSRIIISRCCNVSRRLQQNRLISFYELLLLMESMSLVDRLVQSI